MNVCCFETANLDVVVDLEVDIVDEEEDVDSCCCFRSSEDFDKTPIVGWSWNDVTTNGNVQKKKQPIIFKHRSVLLRNHADLPAMLSVMAILLSNGYGYG